MYLTLRRYEWLPAPGTRQIGVQAENMRYRLNFGVRRQRHP